MLNLAGLDNIALGVVPSMTPLSPEQVLASDPEMIVYTGSHWIDSPESMLLGFQATREKSLKRLRAFTTRPGWEWVAGS